MPPAFVRDQPVAPRASPVRAAGSLAWLRANLFSDWRNSLATIVVALVVLWPLPTLVDWALLNAVFLPDNAACRAVAHGSAHTGACWGVVAEKYRVILFGRFPFDAQWRPLAATLLMIAALFASGLPRVWARAGVKGIAAGWVLVLAGVLLLMHGGFAGLATVESARWGGLPLTLMLATLGMGIAFPVAIFAALGRSSDLPVVRAVCTAYIELVRGVPLISVLFMASFMFPLFLPAGTNPDVLLRVVIGIAFFAAAYLAESIRGGLNAIPRGQYEAAASLGLSYWQTRRHILLPQALRHALPAIMNSFISTFKDTSLVTIVSLYELTGALGLALRGDTDWRPFNFEAYLFIAAIYWAGCHALSAYSRWIERRLDAARP